jgi:hypothetical protein
MFPHKVQRSMFYARRLTLSVYYSLIKSLVEPLGYLCKELHHRATQQPRGACLKPREVLPTYLQVETIFTISSTYNRSRALF